MSSAHPAGQHRGNRAHGERARGGERADVHPRHRLPVAGYPQGPAAALDDLRLLRALELDGTLDRIHDTLYVKSAARPRGTRARRSRSLTARA